MGIDFDTLRFAAPQYLWLLVAPGVLLVGWFWQLAARRRDARRYRQHRRLPVRERFPIFGSLVFWLCLILASACVIVGAYLYLNDTVWKYVVQHVLLR